MKSQQYFDSFPDNFSCRGPCCDPVEHNTLFRHARGKSLMMAVFLLSDFFFDHSPHFGALRWTTEGTCEVRPPHIQPWVAQPLFLLFFWGVVLKRYPLSSTALCDDKGLM
jgi:hypothetical protein